MLMWAVALSWAKLLCQVKQSHATNKSRPTGLRRQASGHMHCLILRSSMWDMLISFGCGRLCPLTGNASPKALLIRQIRQRPDNSCRPWVNIKQVAIVATATVAAVNKFCGWQVNWTNEIFTKGRRTRGTLRHVEQTNFDFISQMLWCVAAFRWLVVSQKVVVTKVAAAS